MYCFTIKSKKHGNFEILIDKEDQERVQAGSCQL